MYWLLLFFLNAMAYVGDPNLCKNCHNKQYNFWENTPHSSAYLVLFSKGDHVNPECIGCHTVGYQQPGGFDKILKPLAFKTPSTKPAIDELMKAVFLEDKNKEPLSLRNQPERYKKLHKKYWDELHKLYESKKISKNFLGVQCENCHGNREEHLKKTGLKLKVIAKNQCNHCHIAPNAEPVTLEMITKMSCPKN